MKLDLTEVSTALVLKDGRELRFEIVFHEGQLVVTINGKVVAHVTNAALSIDGERALLTLRTVADPFNVFTREVNEMNFARIESAKLTADVIA